MAVGVGVEEGEWKSTAAAVRPAVLSGERAVPVVRTSGHYVGGVGASEARRLWSWFTGLQ